MDYDQSVITTESVIARHTPVVYVVHSEGGWQCYGEEPSVEAVKAHTTSLKEIISGNPHVKDILWIPEGIEAWFDPIRKMWQIGIVESE